MNRLGIEMLTLLGMPPVQHVKLAGELGCVAISTGLTGLPLTMFGINDFAPYPAWSLRDDPALRREMKTAMRDSGVHIGLGEGFSARPGMEARDQAPSLDLMAELGARRINAISLEPDTARAHDQLAQLADMSLARGMVFTMEFAPPNAMASLPDALAAIKYIGGGKAKVLLDSMHFFRSGSTMADLQALDPALIGYAQLCDVPMTSAESYMQEAMFARMAPGDGELPLREWVAALPKDCEISLEVPRLADLKAGVSPRDHAARAVAGARAVGV